MIPHYLSLRNFLSYRAQASIDLRGLHLAAITGANGAGKSSILDGITWALFGKSRVRSDDDIVNRVAASKGETAEVEFVFELEGAIYRITRRKAAGKTSELEFHVRGAESNGDARWRVLTEARLRETQSEIERLLRMNYEVFTNASFLLQGEADQFTTKTADKRKEILADILGVSQWDIYKEMATESRKAAEAGLASLDRQLSEIEAELGTEDELKRHLESAEAHARMATAERERQDALVSLARQNKIRADEQRAIVQQMTAELLGIDQELQRVTARVNERQGELANYQALLSRREEVEATHMEWQIADREFQRLQEQSETHSRILRDMHPLELAISRVETALRERLKDLEARRERAQNDESEGSRLRLELDDLSARLASIQASSVEAVHAEEAWRKAQEQLRDLEHGRRLLEQERLQLQARSGQIAAMVQEQEQVEASRNSAAKSLSDVQTQLDALDKGREDLGRKIVEKESLQSEQSRLKEEMSEIKVRIGNLSAEDGSKCPLCGQPLTPAHRRNVIDELETQGNDRGDRYRGNKQQLSVLEGELSTLRSDLEQLQPLMKRREAYQATVNRSEERLSAMDGEIAGWRESGMASRIAELDALLADESEATELRAQIESSRSAVEERRSLADEQRQIEGQVARLQARREQIEAALNEWETEGRAALEETKRRLAENDFAAEDRAAMTELQSSLESVAYDPEAHAAAARKREALAAAPEEKQRLLQAEAAVRPLTESLTDLERQREGIESRKSSLGAQQAAATQRLQELDAGMGNLQEAEAELQRLREVVVEANRVVGGARQRVEVLEVQRANRTKLIAEKAQAARRTGLLRQLEEACGRNGVQATLIEAALPDIEAYANDLLYRLTGGEMRVAFKAQRPRKSGRDNPIETLDIEISDSNGERPYENYSGGEKFRVNFAVRLALSQVLAHRAGAQLRMLVIDEGFGSQDPEGRQRLVEAINAIQDEFECILVITHIEELRDKFPNRIEVEKAPDGSQLTVVPV